MASILVTCYSRTGKTRILADSIGKGAKEVAGVEVDVLQFNRVTASDLVRYDGVILGSPVYFGGVAAELKEFIDSTTFVRGKLSGKIGAAFTTSGDRTGGKETAILSIVQAMLIHGMVVVGDPISPESKNEEHNGGHYGLAADGQLTEADLRHAEYFGRYVATIVARMFN
ncbi:MAG: NAD(P)H-dependent oxidoreductase [Methanocorpusculum sp.]|jgi:NAD(P)H dehydrogenase (quinone)|nr:NAD(P)H-dependent oxidoreductase [Methanocorpusculum sp.]MDD2470821.1 NAD(P)H-dependent oxidoreductase [Methanocorpusculum sp.]MDD3257437.1 NAD(P)H-dependent oxidoreductase [Methanocorpusculum sp.]MDD4133016.1 NAD(P)H-dependent oxidoreductase [Methanocorpusculum sp.]